jgi:hypothetical protein
LADDRTATNFALAPQNAHLYIKIRRKKFTLPAAFRKKVVENSVRRALEADFFTFLLRRDMSHVSV